MDMEPRCKVPEKASKKIDSNPISGNGVSDGKVLDPLRGVSISVSTKLKK